MIISFVKKHSVAFALLAALLAAFAAPYLVPTDPDSAVFRSGTFGALLLIAALFPVRAAIKRHDARSLCYAAGFAFIFTLCLGVGSELAYYDQLLPGMGSLVRRFAVPVMAAPLLGALFSYVFVFAPPVHKGKRFSVPTWGFFLLFAACYGAVLLAMYPGVVSYDFEHEIAQYQSGVFDAAHPVFHTLFLGTLYRLGESLFGSMTAGAAVYSAVQLLLLAALYAWACTFVQRRVSHPLVTLALAACFALLPFHGVMAVSTAKDPLFAGLCVMLCLTLWEAAEAPEAFLASRRRIARFSACCLGIALLRHNGVFAFLPACLAVFGLCKPGRRRAALLAVCSVLLCVLLPKGLETALHATRAPSSEMMSVPCQQLMRTAARAEISEEEYAEISAWFSDAVARYRPHCADPAKGGNFDFARYQADPGAFWSMYLRYARAHPRVYIEAFLENCAGLWNPDDISHSNSLGGEDYDFVYMNTAYTYDDGRYDIHPRSFLPGLKNALYQFTHHSAQQKVPFLSQLFCPATYSFALLLGTLLLFCRRQRRLALCLTPVWGIFLSLLFSAGIFVRYAYPMMAAMPVMLALILFSGKAE